jgi:hypothetical protein
LKHVAVHVLPPLLERATAIAVPLVEPPVEKKTTMYE